MPIPRLQLFEFEDLPWFPSLLRRGMTDYLAEVTARSHPYAPVSESLKALLVRYPDATIVDLCSGGGGPWPELAPTLLPGVAKALVLTDRYPNLTALQRFPPGMPVTYREAPMLAEGSGAERGTVRTLFSSFHHFAPRDAVAVLQRAVAGGTPIAIFEATHRSVPSLLAMLIMPIVVLVLTPLIRPFTWWRLLFTYLIPVLPFLVWWDGTVSTLRTYSVAELQTMSHDPSLAAFAWQAAELRAPKAPFPVTCLIGTPRTGDG